MFQNHKSPSLLLQALSIIAVTQILGLVCWNMVPRLAPLLLDKSGASPSTISWIIGTLPQALVLVLTPIVSIWSDNHRSHWGRRRPFLWWSAPPFCLALLGIHFAAGNTTLLSCALLLFALCAIVPTTLIFYLIPETIPLHYLGRFTAWDGALSSLCAALFNYYGLAWSTRHSLLAIILACAGYILAMAALTAIPRESPQDQDQPQVSLPPSNRRPLFWQTGLSCLQTCWRERIYLLLFLCLGLNQASMILRTLFGILFATKDLGMTIEDFGHISSLCACLGAATAIVLGRLVDRRSPIDFYLHGSLVICAISLIGFFFTRSLGSYRIIAILTTISYSVQAIAYTPLLASILPKDKYGQFSSLNTTVCTLMVMAGSAVGGWLTNYTGFRFMFLWDCLLTGLGTLLLVKIRRLYRQTTLCRKQ